MSGSWRLSGRGMGHPFPRVSVQVRGSLLTGCFAVGGESTAARQGEWVPAFEGQRPPFRPGHELSPTTHGAYSPRKYEPLAKALVDLLLEDPSVPAHAKAPAFRLELWALARATAQAQLIEEWLASQSTEKHPIGDLGDERVRSAYLLLHRAETRSASSRSRLGLTPVAHARLGKNVAQGQAAQVDVALRMAQLHELEEQGWTPPAGWAGAGGSQDEDDDEGRP